jgi:probable rRNA maturation factor
MAFLVDEKNNISIQRMTSGPLPEVPFSVIKNNVLGKNYALDLVFPTEKISKEMHLHWKGKKDPVNVLSFPLDEQSGEMVITLSAARREAHRFDRSYKEHLVRLYIHGLVHLKGHDHGDEMDALEEKVWKWFQKTQK